MPRIKVVVLSDEQRQALEKGALYHAAPSFRLRCQAILLKSQLDAPRTSAQIASELGCCTMSVNDWVARFEAQGIAGLSVKAGRGRRGILQADDLDAVKAAVAKNRQQLRLAKAELEEQLGREFGLLTLKRYLKKTVALAQVCAIQTPATGSCWQAEPGRVRRQGGSTV